ncbi:MAG: hypothetical protein KA354_22720 [Phycisphaerae bacterium]|nr:hypothetical protein [Phycisphaerae bacterium]
MSAAIMKAREWLWLLIGIGVAASFQSLRAADQLPSDSAGASQKTAKVVTFQFGTPTSAARAGFTKVTVKDAFTAEKGYGFRSTQDLEAFDRGGSEIVLPRDSYTASTYGAYRTTADLTCALIEGRTDNSFEVAVPEGEYTVWLIAGDAEWDPPLFEAWANGQKKLDVRIPRARFVFMEPFQARAAEGRLRIEFKGPHGWILNGLVIGRAGPELVHVVAELERDIFFLTQTELPNWKEVRPEPAHHRLDWSEAELERGYVVASVDYTEPVTPTFVPARAAIARPLTAFATPGEFEPASFCVLSHKDLGAVALELSDFVAEKDGRTIPRESVKVGTVRCWPQRVSGWGGKGEYHVVPEMIESPANQAPHVAARQLKQWWLTMCVPQDAPPGRYRMSVTLRPEKAPPITFEWRLLVLPFELVRPSDRHWGTWLESFPPVGGLRGPERRGRNTPAEQARLVKADLADYREHGFDLAIFNYYFGVKENPDGTFTYDISGLARDLEYWKTLGCSTPVAIGCEYTLRNLEYGLAEPGKKHIPGTFSPKAHQAIVGLVRHIRDEAQRRGWPKLYFYPIDEPGNNKTENRMLFAENVLGFVHEVPGCQTATTLTAGDLQRLGDRVDVRIYAYGHYSRNRVLQEVRQGHPFWYYENGMFYGHSTIASRGLTGFEFLRSGAEVATAWGFDATEANPCNDFDGGHKDWNAIFPGVDGPTPTIYWELCREGVDDCRYVATLQQQIRLARTRGSIEAADRAERVLAPLIDPDGQPIENPLTFARLRWRMAREILNLMGDRELAIPFPAIVTSTAAPEKAGPNLVAVPSFEAGPQAGGFPVPSYHADDPSLKPEEKPVGALSVTDEIAHSGRYALKWDFSKAVGKGHVYDGKHYLIVNVQVSPEAARHLRGQRVRVGYWFRLGGGAAVPGMTLRQSGKEGHLGGISYTGGVEDPAVWNHFVAEDRLRADFDSLDIHIACPVPDDAEAARKSLFYIDDVSLQAIEEPPLAVSSPLDEYYLGELTPWSVHATSDGGKLRVELWAGERRLAEHAARPEGGVLHGAFESQGLRPGICTLRAILDSPSSAPQTAQRDIILAPDPFDWPARSQ